MKLRGRHIARNVVSNWAGTFINMALGFFLSPFILHRLGDVAYGVWVLAVSVVGYLSLLDFGMQGAILRYVSQGYAKGDHPSASDALSAALWVRLQISLFALFASGCLAFAFPFLFKIPPAMVTDAREAIVLIGATTAVTMSFGVFGGVISALNRYDLQNYVSLVQSLVRVVGIVIALRTGHGIVAIAFCEFLSAAIGRMYQRLLARRLYPELRISLKRPKSETLRKIWSYSAYTFLGTVAVQLVYQTDNLVVGATVSAAAVTFYAIANSLCRYAGQVISSMSSTFVPAASTYEAAGDEAGLLNLYKIGTQGMLAVAIPMMLTLILRGNTFIRLWMGPKYAHTSGTILVILAVPMFFSFANQTAIALAYGLAKHQLPAKWAIGEGVANLILSVVLVRYFGIYGVAIGTLIPSLIAHLGFWPRYTSRLVKLPVADILFKVWGPVLLAAVPFAVASYLEEHLLAPRNLAAFFAEVLVTLPLFLLAVATMFRYFISTQVIPKLRSMLFAQAV